MVRFKYARPSLLLKWPRALLLLPVILDSCGISIFQNYSLGNDVTTKIWLWSALSVDSTVSKQIVTEKTGRRDFFSKMQ